MCGPSAGMPDSGPSESKYCQHEYGRGFPRNAVGLWHRKVVVTSARANDGRVPDQDVPARLRIPHVPVWINGFAAHLVLCGVQSRPAACRLRHAFVVCGRNDLPAAFPATLHPATAPMEILYIECGAIALAVGMSVEHKFRGFKDEVSSLAARYWAPDGSRQVVPHDMAGDRQDRSHESSGCWMVPLIQTHLC